MCNRFSIIIFCFCCTFIAKAQQNISIQAVYQNLLAAYADARPAPDLVLIPKTTRQGAIAQYIPGLKPTIKIDDKLVDICSSLGKDSLNALALLLSHELAHYYQNHSWCADYAFALQGESMGEKLNFLSKDDKIRSEAQADQLGVFYAAMAGYEVQSIFPKVIDAIYSSYKLPDAVVGYPTKTERKQLAEQVNKEVAELFDIFEGSKYLLLLKKQDLAILGLEQVAKKFPSREILHNLGTAYLFQALEMMPQYEMPFILPIEIDSETRLFTSNRSEKETNTWKNALKKAKYYFEEALRKDENYAAAYQNLACVYLLENNPAAAIGKINELQNITKTLLPEAIEIRAIAHYFFGQNEKAKSGISLSENINTLQWLLALPETYQSEKHSMDFADFILPSIKAKTAQKKNFVKEKLPIMPSGCKIADFDNSRQISENPLIEIMIQRDSFQRCIITTPEKGYKLVQTRSDCKGKTSNGLGVSTRKSQVIDSYGNPSYAILSVQCQYFIYEDVNIIFEFGKEEQLKSWILWEGIKK
jgi:hypothetical protein